MTGLWLARIVFAAATATDVVMTKRRLDRGMKERHPPLAVFRQWAWLVSLVVSALWAWLAWTDAGVLVFGAALHAAAVAVMLANRG